MNENIHESIYESVVRVKKGSIVQSKYTKKYYIVTNVFIDNDFKIKLLDIQEKTFIIDLRVLNRYYTICKF